MMGGSTEFLSQLLARLKRAMEPVSACPGNLPVKTLIKSVQRRRQVLVLSESAWATASLPPNPKKRKKERILNSHIT